MSNAHGMDAFFTREKANEGIEIPLYLPSGVKSEHWIRIRGVDSDAFRMAETESKRDAMRVAMQAAETKDQKITTAQMEDIKSRLLAVLVIAWSFEQECNIENVLAFLKQAPQISDAIDQVSSKRALFYMGVLKPLPDTPSISSDSMSDQKDQNKVSAQA